MKEVSRFGFLKNTVVLFILSFFWVVFLVWLLQDCNSPLGKYRSLCQKTESRVTNVAVGTEKKEEKKENSDRFLFFVKESIDKKGKSWLAGLLSDFLHEQCKEGGVLVFGPEGLFCRFEGIGSITVEYDEENHILTIGSTTIDLSKAFQELLWDPIAGTLEITDGNSVDLSSLRQYLTLDGNQLRLSSANSVIFDGWDTDESDDVKKFVDLEDTPSDYGTAGYLLMTDGLGQITYLDPQKLGYWDQKGDNIILRYSSKNVYLRSGEYLGVGYDPTTFGMGTVAAFNGAVGIGTTNPVASLQIEGVGGNPSLQLGDHYLNQSTIRLFSDTVFNIAYLQVGGIYSHQKGRLVVSKLGSSTDTLEWLKIYSDLTSFSGQVGIGTETPSTSLDVLDSTRIFSLSGEELVISATSLVANDSLNLTSSLGTSFNVGGQDIVTITPSGNVGIGTTNPLARLHVDNNDTNGIVVFSGDIGTNDLTPIYPDSNSSDDVFFIWNPKTASIFVGRPPASTWWDTEGLNFSYILGGEENTFYDALPWFNHYASTILNGFRNKIRGKHNFVATGEVNTINSSYSVILNGTNNGVYGQNGTILNGNYNYIYGSYGAILGGGQNRIYSYESTVLGGIGNYIGEYGAINAESYSVVLGGTYNTVKSSYSVVFGNRMALSRDADNVFVFGFSTTTPPSNEYINTPNSFLIGPYGTPIKVGIGTKAPNEMLTLAPFSNIAVELEAPTNLTATATTGGTLPAATYKFKVVATDGVGYSRISSEITCTVDGTTTNACSLSWDPVPGATGYRVYMTTPTNYTFSRYADVTTNSFTLTSDPTNAYPTGSPPTIINAYKVKISSSGDSWFLGGNIGIGTTTPGQLLQVGEAGDGSAAIANSWLTFSDIRFKEDIEPIDDPVLIVKQLRGVRFVWKESQKSDIGFIAQEVKDVLPEVVREDSRGYLSVDYSRLIPLLVEAIKQISVLLEDEGVLTGSTTKWNFIDDDVLTTDYSVYINELRVGSLNSTLVSSSLLKAINLEVAGGKFAVDSEGQLVLQGDANIFGDLVVEGVLNAKEIRTDKLVLQQNKGVVVIPAGSKSVRIQVNDMTPDTLVFVNQYSGTPVLYTVRRDTGYFEINLAEPASADIEFGWFIIY